MIPRNKFWYGTVYLELLIQIFKFLTNCVKDFTEGSPITPPPHKSVNLENVQYLSG